MCRKELKDTDHAETNERDCLSTLSNENMQLSQTMQLSVDSNGHHMTEKRVDDDQINMNGNNISK